MAVCTKSDDIERARSPSNLDKQTNKQTNTNTHARSHLLACGREALQAYPRLPPSLTPRPLCCCSFSHDSRRTGDRLCCYYSRLDLAFLFLHLCSCCNRLGPDSLLRRANPSCYCLSPYPAQKTSRRHLTHPNARQAQKNSLRDFRVLSDKVTLSELQNILFTTLLKHVR